MHWGAHQALSQTMGAADDVTVACDMVTQGMCLGVKQEVT